MEKIWLKSYRAGVPAEIDLNEYASLNDVLAQSCRKFRDLPAFRNLGTTITYAELDRLSRHFGAWLQSLGLAKGARVALMMPNLLQYPVALFGTLRAGMIVVNVNPLYKARELEHQLKDSGAEAIVILENFAHVLQDVIANTAVKHVVTTQVGDLLTPPKRPHGEFRRQACQEDGAGMAYRRRHPVPRRAGARRPRRSTTPLLLTPISPSCNTPAALPEDPKAPC